MPKLSNIVSTSKVRRRARKIPKFIGTHASASGWTATSAKITPSVVGGYLQVASANGSGSAYQDFTVEPNTRYRYLVQVKFVDSAMPRKIEIGRTAGTSYYDDQAATSAGTYTGTFTSHGGDTTVRLSLTMARPNTTSRFGKILIEEL